MKVELEGKVAVVTGGANGIGRSTVDALVDSGARAAIVDIDKQAGRRTAEEIEAAGGTCLFLEGNVSDAEEMEGVAARIAGHFGSIDILVNAVAPGSTLTLGTEALFYGEDGAYTENAASLLSHIPLGRPGQTAEIAAAVLFLVSPDASYINGSIITVDGGWTAGYARDW